MTRRVLKTARLCLALALLPAMGGLMACGSDNEDALSRVTDPVDTDPCADVVCEAGTQCVDGVCVVEDLCADIVCGADAQCVDGVCVVDDSCLDVVCAAGAQCVDGECACDGGLVSSDPQNVACACTEDSQCGANEICAQDGQCACADGAHVDSESGACVVTVSCLHQCPSSGVEECEQINVASQGTLLCEPLSGCDTPVPSSEQCAADPALECTYSGTQEKSYVYMLPDAEQRDLDIYFGYCENDGAVSCFQDNLSSGFTCPETQS